jgi:hypothetical protein
MSADSCRAGVLRRFGAGDAEVAELLALNAVRFSPSASLHLPLDDEPFVVAWDRYHAESAARGVWNVLRDTLVQLHLPIQAGVSGTAWYRAVTRSGRPVPHDQHGTMLESPSTLRLLVHPTAAGRIPVIVAGVRADFVRLVQALTGARASLRFPI